MKLYTFSYYPASKPHAACAKLNLNGNLGVALGVEGVVRHKLYLLVVRQSQNSLKSLADGDQSRLITISGPDTHTESLFSNIQDNTIHLVLVVLDGLTNDSQKTTQPQVVDDLKSVASIVERVLPSATFGVGLIFPLWLDTFFEQVVVGLQGQLRGGWNGIVNAPEFLDGTESDHWLQQILPSLGPVGHGLCVPQGPFGV